MLKEATFEDKKFFSNILKADPRGMKYVAFYSDVAAWQERDTKNHQTYNFYAGEDLAGFVTVQKLSTSGDVVLEYYISPNHRGKHYGKAVLKELIAHIRNVSSAAQMMFAYVNPENRGSTKALEAAGFLYQGRSGEWELYSYMVQ